MRYLQVILPLGIDWVPFYSTQDETVVVGSRVSVRFSGRPYVGVVYRTDVQPDIDPGKVMPITRHEDSIEPIPTKELELWQFISEYYLCTLGEVYKTAYPKQKISSEMTKARVAERREATQAKVVASIEKRIERLEGTMVRAEAELSKASRPDIREHRAERVSRLSGELSAARKSLEAVVARAAQPLQRSPRAAARKPVLLVCEDWHLRADRLCAEIEPALAGGGNVLLLAPGKPECERFSALLAQHFKESFPAWKHKVTLGTRSAVFTKADNLDLIIVDQEQDRNYKQDSSPLFNSRDVAVYLGMLSGARVILSTDSPTLESIANCRAGKYILQTINSNCTGMVEAISIPAETAKRGMVGLFSRKLIEAINETEGPITIIRGFEKEEDVRSQVADLFPGRDDFRILTAYSCRRDEHKSALTAVLQADVFFAKDDFRADERALQDLQHLRQNCSRLFIQTYSLDRDIYDRLIQGNAFDYDQMLAEREEFGMPPYTRLVDVVIDDDNERRRTYLSQELTRQLEPFGVMGPITSAAKPQEIRLRIILERGTQAAKKKCELRSLVSEFLKARKYDGHARLDVDPA